MWALTVSELKKNIQDKGLWFWTFILPIVFIVGFFAIFSSSGDIEHQALATQIIPGYTVMFSFYIMISIVIAFVKDRERGMVARIASTPLPINQYFIGKWIPFMIIVMIQIFVLFSFGVLVYDLPLGDFFALLILSLALSFISTSWGMAMAVLVKTENMGIAITQVIALGGAMLAGLWMPIDMMPTLIQNIAKFLPQYWALQGYQTILLENGGITDIWFSLFVLLAFGTVGGIVAILFYPQFLRQSNS